MFTPKTIALAFGSAVLLAGAAQAQTTVVVAPGPGTEAGTLNCSVAGGVGLILGSSKPMECRYKSADGKVAELYTGRVNKFGLDVGVTGKSVIIWNVMAPTNSLRPGALEGTYTGVTAQATAGAGVGANVLVGGSDKTISLQPVSVSAQSGLNLAAGIGSITLESEARR